MTVFEKVDEEVSPHGAAYNKVGDFGTYWQLQCRDIALWNRRITKERQNDRQALLHAVCLIRDIVVGDENVHETVAIRRCFDDV